MHKTEVIKITLNPTWRPFTVPVRAVCNGDYDRVIKIECYDWDKDGGHDFIGECFSSLNELKRGPCPENVYEVSCRTLIYYCSAKNLNVQTPNYSEISYVEIISISVH